VIELERGDVVPADGRLLEDTDLEVDEAALTGESAPVSKSPDPIAQSDFVARAVTTDASLVRNTFSVTLPRK
jgi:Ca2+-transporting ATPase